MNNKTIIAREIVGYVQSFKDDTQGCIQYVEEVLEKVENERDLLRINPLSEPLNANARKNMIDFDKITQKMLDKYPYLEYYFIEDLNPMGKKLVQFKKNLKRRPTTIKTYNKMYENKYHLELTEEGNLKVILLNKK